MTEAWPLGRRIGWWRRRTREQLFRLYSDDPDQTPSDLAARLEGAAWRASGMDPAAADGAALGLDEAVAALTAGSVPRQAGPPPVSGPIPLAAKGRHTC